MRIELVIYPPNIMTMHIQPCEQTRLKYSVHIKGYEICENL